MFRSRGMRRHTNVGVLLLFLQLCQAGWTRIPPVTLSVILFNLAVYLGCVHPFLNKPYPHPMQVCVGVDQVWKYGEYWRLVEATFYHADDMHLYFNMVSFLWKGIFLENRISSKKFLSIIAIMSVGVNALMLYINYVLAICFQDPTYLTRCAVGFSGVVFGVKVITTHMMPNTRTILLGIFPVNSRLSCWFELLLIQIIVPNASFTGHLAGILVGLAFTRNPLKRLLDINIGSCDDHCEHIHSYMVCNESASSSESDINSCAAGLSEDEQIRLAMQESLNDYNIRYRGDFPFVSEGYNSQQSDYPGPTSYTTQPSAPPPPEDEEPPAYGWNIHTDSDDERISEMRRRRLERFSNLSRR